MTIFSKKQDELYNGNVYLINGISLKEPLFYHGNIFLNILLRAFVLFSITLGTVGSFLSSFEIYYDVFLVIFLYFVFSFYFSLIYATTKTLYRDIGYILFFFLFVGVIFLFRVHANSGFYVIVNHILQKMRDFFHLSGVREYEVMIQNDFLTVSIVAAFIGMIVIILLNILLSNSMGFVWIIFLTFPLLFLPLYMKLNPNLFYATLLWIGYLTVIVLKANAHFRSGLKQPFFVEGKKYKQIIYSQDFKSMGVVFLWIGMIVLGVCVLTQTFFSEKKFQSKLENDTFREQTKDMVSNFIMFGFSGLHNRYEAVGGMSGGQLGGIASVKTDFQTDLVVSYTPYSNMPVYLKGYTGGAYGENQWEGLYAYSIGKRKDEEIFREESLEKEVKILRDNFYIDDKYGAMGKMDITNVGANPSYLYYPYYTFFEDYSIYNNHSLMLSAQGIPVDETITYEYYPQVVLKEGFGNKIPLTMNKENVDPVFLEVPKKNEAVILEECKKIGLTYAMTENEIVDRVKNYFEENIPYTLKPGITPEDEDFINFFLTENRKGYCAHFASAATLIFRKMGIPARYVEGYAFSLENALASDENKNKKYEDYYSGYSELGKSAVIDVEVTDAMAHAWVEIYIAGFGWKTVEVTPGSNEIGDEEDFWSAFDNFISNTNTFETDNKTNQNLLNIKFTHLSWIARLILTFFLLVGSYCLLKLLLRKKKRYAECHQENQKEAVVASYKNMCEMIRICHTEFNQCGSHAKQIKFIFMQYEITDNLEEITDIIEKISFSNQEISNQKIQFMLCFIQKVRKIVWRKANWKQRIQLIQR